MTRRKFKPASVEAMKRARAGGLLSPNCNTEALFSNKQRWKYPKGNYEPWLVRAAKDGLQPRLVSVQLRWISEGLGNARFYAGEFRHADHVARGGPGSPTIYTTMWKCLSLCLNTPTHTGHQHLRTNFGVRRRTICPPTCRYATTLGASRRWGWHVRRSVCRPPSGVRHQLLQQLVALVFRKGCNSSLRS